MLYYKRRLKFCLYIPFEIQLEIIKRLVDVKSLIRFRSVSKQWKSFIDSSYFIASYGVRHTQPHHLHFFYKDVLDPSEKKYACFVDDDNDNFTQQQQDCASTLSMITKQLRDPTVIGCSHGLLCLHGRILSNEKKVVLWNPCIRKSVVIVVPFEPYFLQTDYGFGVCPVTNDPTIVKISYPNRITIIKRNMDKTHWEVEVFTLSSGVWNRLPCSNMPRGSIRLDSSQVVIDRFIYWAAYKRIDHMHGHSRDNYMIMSFDLIAKQFRVIDIPDGLKFGDPLFSISKLMESLVLFVCGEGVCDVWKMEHDGSFAKLFTINTPDNSIRSILGFRKNGELVMETRKEGEQFEIGRENGSAVEVLESCSKRTKNLGIHGKQGSFFMCSYKETLLLLDHSDCYEYPVINDH